MTQGAAAATAALVLAGGAPAWAGEAATGVGHAAPVPGWVTGLFALLLVAMIAALALEEKLHAKKSVITGVAALVTLFLGVALGIMPDLHETPVTIGEHVLHIPLYVAAIEWEVIAIILGASLFVDVTSRSGIFTWVAVKLTKRSGGDPLNLLIAYGVLTVVFSAFLNNVTAMIIVGSLTAVRCAGSGWRRSCSASCSSKG